MDTALSSQLGGESGTESAADKALDVHRHAEPYASVPLDAANDSTRLVKIESDLNDEGLLVCELEAVTFAQVPRYEALSYRWGDPSVRKSIVVNGVELSVTINLWDALNYFRKFRRYVPLWIDAISINQEHIPEKNQQLRFMPHIYTRARTVLVWLGAKYCPEPQSMHLQQVQDYRSDVAGDEYWKRLWIVQEIGNANKVEVCIGNQALDWDVFRNSVPAPPGLVGTDRGALWKLDFTRRERRDGGCSLMSLLSFHQDAECKDPRDKIYGLVGLSSDGNRFPMDYRNTLFDVWVDTVNFVHFQELITENVWHQVSFYKLIRDLLGGAQLEAPTGVVQFHHLEYWAEDKPVIILPSYLLGEIKIIGPTVTELMSSVTLMDDWLANLQRTYSLTDLRAARREHDSIIRMICEDPDHKLPKLSLFGNQGTQFQSSNCSLCQDQDEGDKKPCCRIVIQEPRLALISNEDHPHRTPYKLAFVPPAAQSGDAICRIAGPPMKKIVARQTGPRGLLRMRPGTAVMIRDILEKPTWDRIMEEAEATMERVNVALRPKALYAVLFGDEDEQQQPSEDELIEQENELLDIIYS